MNQRAALRLFLLSPLLTLAACYLYDTEDQVKAPVDSQYTVVKDLLPLYVQDVDLLFVVDNSGSMAENQASIATWAHDALFGVLGMPDGSPLNLHVAVISTDMGAGPYGIQNCQGDGDQGQFQAGTDNCAAIPGGFLVDVDDGQGGRTTNYAGALSEAFACLAQVGTSGCGFEQPLAAMKRALDGSSVANQGFLRPDALLAVIIISDEDDCSVADTGLFDSAPSLDSIDSPLGFLSSFRCFDFGVECTEDARTPGAKTACVERANSAYLASVHGYVSFLQGLKADPNMVYVAGIFGDTDTVSVSAIDGEPMLDPSCSTTSGQAAPGVRLKGFLDSFPDRNRFASVCSESMSGPLALSASGINETVGRSLCLQGAVKDVDSSSPGLQTDCKAIATQGRDAAQRSFELPDCGTRAEGPCYQLKADMEACAGTATTLAIDLSRAGTFAEGHRIELKCL